MTQGTEAAVALRGAVRSLGSVRAVDCADGTDQEFASGGSVAVLGFHRTDAGTVRLFGAVRAGRVGAMPHPGQVVLRDIVREQGAFTNGRCPSPPRVAGALERAVITEPAGRHGGSLSSGRGRRVGCAVAGRHVDPPSGGRPRRLRYAVAGRHGDTLSSSRGQRVRCALAGRHDDPLSSSRPRHPQYAVTGRHRDTLSSGRGQRVRYALTGRHDDPPASSRPRHPPHPVTGRHNDTLSNSRGQRVRCALAGRHDDPPSGGRPRRLRYALAGRHDDPLSSSRPRRARYPVAPPRRVRYAVAVSGEPGRSVLDEPGHPPAPEAVLVRGVCPRLLGSYAVLSYRRHAGHL
ncbi:hypothetical protein [Streptomyces sviceus]|uniref:hypothetical protein n=1 Tax=Streptomyces sviceus TaxID=285530 RepID=UPI0036E260CC